MTSTIPIWAAALLCVLTACLGLLLASLNFATSDQPIPQRRHWLARKRFWFVHGLGAAVVGLLYVTDPDKGGSTTLAIVIGLLACTLAVSLAHLGRKSLHDYPEADMRNLFRMAGQGPTGAGLALIAQAIVFAALLLAFAGKVHAAPPDVHTFIPTGAYTYAPMLRSEQTKHWPDHPAPWLLGGLVEQESCPSLMHSFCWAPTARLKSAREEGAGMPQITRAYRADGSIRFDALEEQRDKHRAELGELTWRNVYQRPDLQLRLVVLMTRDLYRLAVRSVPDPLAALAFADAAYNGGWGGVTSERRACGLKPGCNPQVWFGHVEHTCTKSRAALYGRRSACDINREHVDMVLRVRSPKYFRLMVA